MIVDAYAGGHTMNEAKTVVSQMRAITLSREYGSGGGEIAKRLAARLGWQLIDHEIVAQIARELNISEKEAENYDEHGDKAVSLLLDSMRAAQPAMFATSPALSRAGGKAYHGAMEHLIEAAIVTGHAVIVGRGAQIVLGERRDALHVRVIAPLEQRVIYVMQRENREQAEARARIQLKDRDRSHYLQSEYRHHPDEAHLYDLLINTDTLDLDSAVDIILLALERKAIRLAVPTGEVVGPGAGLDCYASSPDDVYPSEG